VKLEFAAGVAVKATTVPSVTGSKQVPVSLPAVLKQLMVLGGAPTTVPVPVPVPSMVSVRMTAAVKFACTVALPPATVCVQTLAGPSLSQFVQPVKLEFAAGVAVKVTTVPSVTVSKQVPVSLPAVLKQLMVLGGAPTTVPVPVPVPSMVSVRMTAAVKFACTVALPPATVCVQTLAGPTLSQFVQPVKLEFAAGVAVKVTTVPSVTGSKQVAVSLPAGLKQLMVLGGAPTTVPVPVPVPSMVSVRMTAAVKFACTVALPP